MQDLLRISLAVTGIGMLALFLALFVLYCLMYLLTSVLRDRPAHEIPPAGTGEHMADRNEDSLAAAAVAIAVARAELELSGSTTPSTGGGHSSWRTLHHQRHLSLGLGKRKRQ